MWFESLCQRVFQPELQSVSVHSVEVVLMKVLVSDKAKVLIQAESSLIGHFCLQDNLGSRVSTLAIDLHTKEWVVTH